MAKRSRHRPTPIHRQPTGPTTLLADRDPDHIAGQIRSGELDNQLPQLIDAINQRRSILENLRATQAIARLHVGDEVRINHSVSPQYLHGLLGEIHQIDNQHVIVCLGRPVGRFKSGHVRCPATALEPTGRVRT